jgi:hypothetical protein
MEKKSINEVTSASGSGSYKNPITLAAKIWKNSNMGAYTIPVSDYLSAQLAYDSYDGHMDDYTKEEISKLEKKAEKQSKTAEKFFSQNDEDGNPFNGYSPMGNPLAGTPKSVYKQANLPKKEKEPVIKNKKISEATSTSLTSGPYSGPVELGLKKWLKSQLSPYEKISSHESNEKKKQKTMKNNIEKTVGVWEKGKDGGYEIDIHDVHTIKEDLGVWFGTKKKPKGSKQPKGPWVNICRKKEGGGHPPCGRPDADPKGYPKCRAAGVASKMTDSQKKAACAQKRNAEKKDTQTGKGQKPVMTSYKPKNESLREMIKTVLREQKTT